MNDINIYVFDTKKYDNFNVFFLCSRSPIRNHQARNAIKIWNHPENLLMSSKLYTTTIQTLSIIKLLSYTRKNLILIENALKINTILPIQTLN